MTLKINKEPIEKGLSLDNILKEIQEAWFKTIEPFDNILKINKKNKKRKNNVST